MSIKVVCFDLGGVLVRICHTFAAAVKAAGLPLQELNWSNSAHSQAGWIRLFQSGKVSFAEYVRAFQAASAGAYSLAQLECIHEAILLESYSGADELISSLQRAGCITACLSNTNEPHWLRLRGHAARTSYPALAKLTYALASHELGMSKPDAAIYTRAESIFAVHPSEIVFFDDLSENVEAARLNGWNAHQVDASANPPQQMREILTRLGIF